MSKTLEEQIENLVHDTVNKFGIHENPVGLLECETDDLKYLATQAYKKGEENGKKSK